MKIEIWSDIACPWCYLGRRRLETALEQFAHRDQVEIIWRSYELDPTADRHYDGTTNDLLMRKYGMSRQQAEAAHERIVALGVEMGINYRFDRTRPGNSFDAHRLIHFAAHHGLQSEMKERLQKAYFTDGLSFSDPDTLVQLAAEIGLESSEARRVVESDAYEDAVRADEQRAMELGIRGVPYFLFEEKYAVSGAQPVELFVLALNRTWDETQPAPTSP